MLEQHRPIQKALSAVGTDVGLGGEEPQPLAEALLPFRHFEGLSRGLSSALCSTWIGIPSKREPGRPELRRLRGWVGGEAVGIFIGVFSNMDPLMLHEDALVVEPLSTDETLVWLGSGGWGQQGRVPEPQQTVTLSSSGRGLAPFVDHPMLLQLVRLQEGLAAVGAHEEVLVHVGAHVRDEVGALAEALAALGALVGLLARVRAAVLDEVGAADEALAAVGALVGLLTRVDALVADEGGAHDEALAAVGADVGPLAAVDALVVDEVGADAEALAALGALVGPLARVRALVPQQRGAQREGLAAHRALEGVLA